VEEPLSVFRKSCLRATNEEDIRVATNLFLSSLTKYLGLQSQIHNEVTYLFGGRADSVYKNLIFEFKSPKKFKNQKGIDEALYGRDEKDRGLFNYLVNSALEEATVTDNESFLEVIKSKVGIAFDGHDFIFVRFKSSAKNISLNMQGKTKWTKKSISHNLPLAFDVDVSPNLDAGIRKLSLMARSTQKKILSADNLLESFSSQSQISKETIHYLYGLLNEGMRDNPRIKTLYKEWLRIFGEIYGDTETDFTSFRSELNDMYDLPRNADIKKSLFVLQTYYSIVIKLMIQNLFFSLRFPLQTVKKPKHKSDLSSLFSGGQSSESLVDNFFEFHFFEWFILSEDLEMSYFLQIINELDYFETTASVIKPEVVRDVLKKMYQSLIPRGLRHLMGEYYTPDWLVDFTIEKSGFDWSLDTTALDPTCGSGTFLTHLISGLSLNNRETPTNEKIAKITQNIVGFDINPIAVISAKANYILALGDITALEKSVSIPVYMCDSILVPTVHAKQVLNNKAIAIETAVGNFKIPIFESRESSDLFLGLMSKSILTDYTSFEEFYGMYRKETGLILDKDQTDLASELYEKLHSLHLSGKNGFWPIILKNSFAPLFSHDKFDFVIGNPPWITWKAMSDTYRKMTLDIWLSYGIFEKSAYDKITSHDDFAMAVTYVCIDHYLKSNGKASLILPQTFVKSSKGGEGFRKFKISRDGLDIPFAIDEVYDMLEIKPFKGEASNRASVYNFKKNVQMHYPMKKYYECYLADGSKSINYSDSWVEVQEKIKFRKLHAKPINDDIRSPWLTMTASTLSTIEKYLGDSYYKARKGIEPFGAKGIYLVESSINGRKQLVIKNLIERSRLEKAKTLGIHEGIVEPDFIYPMVGGRNFDKWGLNSYLHMIVPHYNQGQGIYRGVDESDLKTNYPKTYNWLFYFKDLLLETRIRSGKFFDPKQFPFYRLDNVGDYTFSEYKVLWKEQSKQMTAVVVSKLNDPYLGSKKVVTDSKVLFVSTDSELEAHYLCGVLNSRLIGEIIESYTIDVQKGVDVVKNIKIPKFDSSNKIHQVIAKQSLLAHKSYLGGDKNAIKTSEKLIEAQMSELFD